jgi:transposase-like protein
MAKKGRPTLLNKQLKEIAVRLANEKGMTIKEMASKLGIGRSTLFLYLQQDKDLLDAVKGAMEMADDLVEISLYRRATGYTHAEEKIFCHEGQVIRAKTLKHYPPDTGAAQWWLRNRRPEQWRDKPEADESDEKPIVISVDEQNL